MSEAEILDEDRMVYARFGGDKEIRIPDGPLVNVGQVVCSAGPGEGFALLPWALFDYAGPLGLTPARAFVLTALMRHAWTFGGEVYPSMKLTARRLGISRTTLRNHITALCDAGLIKPVRGVPDGRVTYDVSSVYIALALAIITDPASAWSKLHGGPVDRRMAALAARDLGLHIPLRAFAEEEGEIRYFKDSS